MTTHFRVYASKECSMYVARQLASIDPFHIGCCYLQAIAAQQLKMSLYNLTAAGLTHVQMSKVTKQDAKVQENLEM